MITVLRMVSKIASFVFALFLFCLGIFFAYNMLRRVFPNDPLYSLAGLGLFDVAALVWFATFLFYAKGLVQRAISFIMFTVSLIFAAALAIGEVIMAQAMIEIPPGLAMVVVYSIAGAVIVNMVSIYAFHLTDVNVNDEIEEQNREDKAVADAAALSADYEQKLRPHLSREIAKRRLVKQLGRLDLDHNPHVIEAAYRTLDIEINAPHKSLPTRAEMQEAELPSALNMAGAARVYEHAEVAQPIQAQTRRPSPKERFASHARIAGQPMQSEVKPEPEQPANFQTPPAG